MSPNVPGWLAFSRRVGRVTGMFRTGGAASTVRAVDRATRPFTEGMRSLAAQRTTAEETAKALAERSKRELRELTVITVRCPGNSLLLRVVRIPDHLPGAAYDGHLVIPSSATMWRLGDGQQITARAWFLAEHDETLGVRCRCHPEVALTLGQLLGESLPPPGIRVLPF